MVCRLIEHEYIASHDHHAGEQYTNLFSSRDHQFVQTTANRIIEIMPNGQIIDKITTYDEYLESDEMARKRQVYSMSEDDENDN